MCEWCERSDGFEFPLLLLGKDGRGRLVPLPAYRDRNHGYPGGKGQDGVDNHQHAVRCHAELLQHLCNKVIYPPLYNIFYGPSGSLKGEIDDTKHLLTPLKLKVQGEYAMAMSQYEQEYTQWEAQGNKHHVAKRIITGQYQKINLKK